MSCAQVKLTSLQHSFNTLVCSLDLSPDIKMQVVQKQHDATMKTQNKQIFYKYSGRRNVAKFFRCQPKDFSFVVIFCIANYCPQHLSAKISFWGVRILQHEWNLEEQSRTQKLWFSFLFYILRLSIVGHIPSTTSTLIIIKTHLLGQEWNLDEQSLTPRLIFVIYDCNIFVYPCKCCAICCTQGFSCSNVCILLKKISS